MGQIIGFIGRRGHPGYVGLETDILITLLSELTHYFWPYEGIDKSLLNCSKGLPRLTESVHFKTRFARKADNVGNHLKLPIQANYQELFKMQVFFYIHMRVTCYHFITPCSLGVLGGYYTSSAAYTSVRSSVSCNCSLPS